jgi:hypothetical protein
MQCIGAPRLLAVAKMVSNGHLTKERWVVAYVSTYFSCIRLVQLLRQLLRAQREHW